MTPVGPRGLAALRGTIGVALVLATLAWVLAAGSWTWRADRVVYDFGLSAWQRPAPEGITVVAIDDASVAAIGRWPWPRAVHSTLLARLAEARPKAIGLDVIFSEPDPDPAQDALLARQLALAAPVVLSVAWQPGGPGLPPRLLMPVTGLPPGVTVGTAESSADPDGVMRHVFLDAGWGQTHVPHMALALMQAAGEAPAPGLPLVADPEDGPATGAQWQRGNGFLVRFTGPPGQLDSVSYVEVLLGAVRAERLRGRYLLVVMTATGLGDTVATPMQGERSAMPGVEVLGHALYTLRSGDTVHAVTPLASALFSALGVIALLASFQQLGARWALLLAVVSVPVVIVASLLALGAGWWWSPVPWVMAAALAYPLWSWRRLELAVDALDAEIGRLVPEGGVAPGAAVARGFHGPSDPLTSRLDTLQVATSTVRSARRFLSDALAGLPTAMAVTDERGTVLLANTLAARLFEVDTAERMQGMDLPGLLVEFVPMQPVQWETLLSLAHGPPASQVVEARLERLGDFLLHFAPVMLLEQQRWVVTFADISAIKQAQRRRDQALAFVSHDLRSPANTIMLLADLHREGRMHMPQDELLAEVQRLAARTLQLADDFVRVAHVESRPLQVEAVPVRALLEEIVADFRPQALSAGLGLAIVTEDPGDGLTRAAPPRWHMDRALVQRAVGNLVSNALKHSPAGGEVQLTADEDPEQGILRLTVADQGPGLRPEQRQRLNQGDDGLPAGDSGGVGLGLQFVQRVALRHRGRLRALPGRGEVGSRLELSLGRLPAEDT